MLGPNLDRCMQLLARALRPLNSGLATAVHPSPRLELAHRRRRVSDAGTLWPGFLSAQRAVLIATARAETPPPTLILGLYNLESILAQPIPLGVLAFPGIQYLKFSEFLQPDLRDGAIERAIEGTRQPLPAAFLDAGIPALCRIVHELRHCLRNAATLVSGWAADSIAEPDAHGPPAALPYFVRADQEDSVTGLAEFDALADAVLGRAGALGPLRDQWRSISASWTQLQRAARESASVPTFAAMRELCRTILHQIQAFDTISAALLRDLAPQEPRALLESFPAAPRP